MQTTQALAEYPPLVALASCQDGETGVFRRAQELVRTALNKSPSLDDLRELERMLVMQKGALTQFADAGIEITRRQMLILIDVLGVPISAIIGSVHLNGTREAWQTEYDKYPPSGVAYMGVGDPVATSISLEGFVYLRAVQEFRRLSCSS